MMPGLPDDPGVDPNDAPAEESFSWLVLCVMVVGLVCCALFWGISKARAHSFYLQKCCSDQDCRPVAAGEIKRTAKGWLTARGVTVPFDDPRVIPTPPMEAGMHLCERPDGSVICIYVPGADG